MLKILAALLLTTLPVFGQTRKEFDVASIRPSAELQPQVAVGFQVDGSQVHISYLSLKDYISRAYHVNVNQVVGPDWLGTQRFDIAAKLPEGEKQSDVNDMLQSLLSDRFRMKVHREMRDFPVYVLEVTKTGLKIDESAPESAFVNRDSQPLNMGAGGTGTGVSVNYGNGSTFTVAASTLETKKLTMEMFCYLLTRFMDRPVIDMTKLKGGYDLTLSLSPEDRYAMLIRSAVAAGVTVPSQTLALLNTASGSSLTESLRTIGLSLETRKAPLDVVVVDEMQKIPTEN